MLGGSHGLVQLITQCLDYAPSARPTASEAVDRLQHISSSIHDIYHSMTRLQLEKALEQSEKRQEVWVMGTFCHSSFSPLQSVLVQSVEAMERERAFVGDEEDEWSS